MSDITELLRRKEEELVLIQKEVEALRLVACLIQQGKEVVQAPVKPPIVSVPVSVEIAPRPVIRSSPPIAAETPISCLVASENVPRQFP